MAIEHVLAVVPVADFEASHAWYERFFGRPADNIPMEGQLVEWRLTESGWLQVTTDPERAGSALVNFAVDDLDRHTKDPRKGTPSGGDQYGQQRCAAVRSQGSRRQHHYAHRQLPH
jgi:glyoxylase I family protein